MGYFNLKTKTIVLEKTIRALTYLNIFKDYYLANGMMEKYHTVTSIIETRMGLETKLRQLEESDP